MLPATHPIWPWGATAASCKARTPAKPIGSVLREAIEEEKETTLDIINYRANGERFVNRLMITPLKDDDQQTTHFLGIQTERPQDASIAERALHLDESMREFQHRVKNHLSMLLALIRLEARQTDGTRDSFEILANRVQTLSLLYDEFAAGRDGVNSVGLGAYVSRVCAAMNMLDGQNNVVVNVDADVIDAKVDAASQVGLLVSELLTNALQHAFDEDSTGTVEVRLGVDDGDRICLRVADDGHGLPEGSKWPEGGNLGSRIVRDLANRLNAEMDVASGEGGTVIELLIPRSSIE